MLIVKKTLPTASLATRSVNGPTECGATGHGPNPGERPSVSWLVKPCRARTTRERYFFRGGADQFCLANIKGPPRVPPAVVPAPLPPSG